MIKKVNFYTVDMKSVNGEDISYKDIKDVLISIIKENATELKGFSALDLSNYNELHYSADIFDYKKNRLIMRVSCQKPSGSYLHRNYTTSEAYGVLEGINEEQEGIEVYTYILLNYETGILAIVNQQGAPSYKIINSIFEKFKQEYYLEFIAIPNANGITRIYDAKDSKISSIEIEVPIPSAEVLQQMFHWKDKDILDVQGNKLKATVKLSGVGRRVITDNEEDTKKVIDVVKDTVPFYLKAKVRAKAKGVKAQDYSFFDENFTYPIDIQSYEIIGDRKRYYSADELVGEYKSNLIMAYVENEQTLKLITDR